MKTFLVGVAFLLLLSGCRTLKYGDPDSDAILEYSSFASSANDVQIIFTSPEKTIAVSIGSIQNDQLLEQAGDIVRAQKIGDDK